MYFLSIEGLERDGDAKQWFLFRSFTSRAVPHDAGYVKHFISTRLQTVTILNLFALLSAAPCQILTRLVDARDKSHALASCFEDGPDYLLPRRFARRCQPRASALGPAFSLVPPRLFLANARRLSARPLAPAVAPVPRSMLCLAARLARVLFRVANNLGVALDHTARPFATPQLLAFGNHLADPVFLPVLLGSLDATFLGLLTRGTTSVTLLNIGGDALLQSWTASILGQRDSGLSRGAEHQQDNGAGDSRGANHLEELRC